MLVTRASHFKVRLPRRAGRGIALLMALALIAFITAAAIISLRSVATESTLQSHERRGREAFFAAQAGLAEAREVVRLKLGTATQFDTVIATLGTRITESGLPSSDTQPWYEVIPWRPYTLAASDAGLGVDPAFSGANREMNGPEGTRIDDYPTGANVRYRVFLVDDEDGTARTSDNNSQVWLVAVGEVAGPTGTQPLRSIVRALISAGTSGGSAPPCWDEGCEDNSGG
ncbi:MAG TPA: hypothetical protein VE153_23080 [Myxococcus sp.]|nr:hypothetical protein [Myxococcus sp.]